jgi:single-strand DNA-binding protein
MNDINTVTLTGRLTRDAELKYTSGGMAISEFAIAVNGSKKNGDKWEQIAAFFDCTMFGKRAESLANYMEKGKQVAIAGRLDQQRWKSQEGQNRSKIVLIVNDVTLLGGKGEDRPARPQRQEENTVDDFEDDVPF